MRRHSSLLLLPLLLFGTRSFGAALVAVTSQKSGAWTDPSVWGLASGYPADGVMSAYDVTATEPLTLPAIAVTVTNLTFSGGSITGVGASSSTISVANSLTVQSGEGISNMTLHVLAGATATVNRVRPWVSSTAAIINDGVFNVNAGFPGAAAFTNNGTVVFNSGDVVVNQTFTNNGVVSIQSGSVTTEFFSGVGGAGEYDVAAGATLNLAGFDPASAVIIKSAGDVNFNVGDGANSLDGTLSVSGKTTFNVEATLDGQVTTNAVDVYGALVGTASMTANGLLNWRYGNLELTGGVTANAGIVFGSTHGFSGTLEGTLINAEGSAGEFGLAGFQGFTLTLSNGATLRNEGSLVLHAGTFWCGSGATDSLVENTGTLTIDAAGDTFHMDNPLGPGEDPRIAFNNRGLIHVQAGTLELSADDGGGNTGTIQVDAGAALVIDSPVTFATGSTITGAGDVTIGSPWNVQPGGPVFNGAYTITGTTLLDGPATFNSDMTFGDISGDYATILGTGHLTVNGSLQLDGTSTVRVASLTLNGGMIITGGDFTFAGNITNNAGSTMTMNGDVLLDNGVTLTNKGNLNWVGGYVRHVIATSGQRVINCGTINVSSGTAFDSTVTFINHGKLNVTSQTFYLGYQAAETDGEFHVDEGATLKFEYNYDFSGVSGPTLTGDGTVVIAAGATLTLPVDTAFDGTIEIDGVLLLAAARNPLDADAVPLFQTTGLGEFNTTVPEPGSLAWLIFGMPLAARWRRRGISLGSCGPR